MMEIRSFTANDIIETIKEEVMYPIIYSKNGKAARSDGIHVEKKVLTDEKCQLRQVNELTLRLCCYQKKGSAKYCRNYRTFTLMNYTLSSNSKNYPCQKFKENISNIQYDFSNDFGTQETLFSL